VSSKQCSIIKTHVASLSNAKALEYTQITDSNERNCLSIAAYVIA